MNDSDLLMRLRDLPGPEAGRSTRCRHRRSRPEKGTRQASRDRHARARRCRAHGLESVGVGRDRAWARPGDSIGWRHVDRAPLVGSDQGAHGIGEGLGARGDICGCTVLSRGTNLTLGTPDSDVLGYVPPVAWPCPRTRASPISFTNSITATNGDPSSMGLSIYESPSDAFILGDRESPWTVTSETEANALFRGDNVSTGNTRGTR